MVKAFELRNPVELAKIPKELPGYYKWWADIDSLNIILRELKVNFHNIEKYLEKKDDLYCIYVGIACKESIRARLNWHVNDSHTLSKVKNRTLSTLRQSISSIVAHNQSDKNATNRFIDRLEIEYFPINHPIKSELAIKETHEIERQLLNKNLYVLNIQENYHFAASPIKKELKELRKKSMPI